MSADVPTMLGPAQRNQSGGPGRTRTSNQAVMSASNLFESRVKSVSYDFAWPRLEVSERGDSLVIHWSDDSRLATEHNCGLLHWLRSRICRSNCGVVAGGFLR